MEEYQAAENAPQEGYTTQGGYYPQEGDSEEAFDELEGQEDYGEAELMGYSEQKQLGGLYALFNELLSKKDTTRISNVDPKTELGHLPITIRDAKLISHIAKSFGHPKFAKFFDGQSEITTQTAMSKEG